MLLIEHDSTTLMKLLVSKDIGLRDEIFNWMILV